MSEELVATYKPQWISVQVSHGGDVFVRDLLRHRKYTLRGHLAEIMADVANQSTDGELPNRHCNSQDQKAINYLQSLGILTTDDVQLPLSIPAHPTLFGLDHTDLSVNQGQIVVLGCPTNVGNRHAIGTCDAPDILRSHSDGFGVSLGTKITIHKFFSLLGLDGFESLPDVSISLSDFGISDMGNIIANDGGESEAVYNRIKRAVSSILDASGMPLIIGGDHSISGGALSACADYHETFDVIHIDAHTDTYTNMYDSLPGTKPTLNHANVMGWALGKIPNIHKIHQFGIRGLGNVGQEASVRQVIHSLHETRLEASSFHSNTVCQDHPCYLSLDIDVLDPAVAPGTASPLPNGLQLRELLYLLFGLIMGNKIIGFDIVELDTTRDKDNITQIAMLEVIVFVLICIKLKDGNLSAVV